MSSNPFGKSLVSDLQDKINSIFDVYQKIPRSNYTAISLFFLLISLIGGSIVILWTGIIYTILHPGESFLFSLFGQDYLILDQLNVTAFTVELFAIVFLARFLVVTDMTQKITYSDIIKSLPKQNLNKYFYAISLLFLYSLLFLKDYEYMDIETIDYTWFYPFYGEPIRYGVFTDKLLFLLADLLPIFFAAIVYHSNYTVQNPKIFKDINWAKVVSTLLLFLVIQILLLTIYNDFKTFIIQPITTYVQNPFVSMALYLIIFVFVTIVCLPAKAAAFGKKDTPEIINTEPKDDDEILDI
ncbi:MAG: hypothetical protein R2780_10180 [Crocinitomicaceae bacterium]|nr:hypothetical protein [Crocinitomicaceae bacterium]